MSRYSDGTRNIKGKVLAGFVIILMLVLSIFVSTNWVLIDTVNISSYDLPRAFHNIKICYASDFNYNGGNKFKLYSIISKINQLRADIVILGGNYGVDYKKSLEFFKDIPNIHARLGVVAVLGENDREEKYSKYYDLKMAMTDRSINLLVNEDKTIKINDGYIKIYGIDDYVKGSPITINTNCGFKENEFVIFAGHSPKGIDDIILPSGEEAVSQFIDLAMFGGTLGGQFAFWQDIKAAFDPTKVPMYYTGWNEQSRVKILVSNGVGAQNPPFRWMIFPQVHEIVLKYN
ncbi:MAG: hypothetical protein GYA87_05415 [Christensenellaceae bacterium]|nr:hypothetical protein [Christensenellaceae bacterium]